MATDIDNVSLETFGGALRVSPLPVPPISILQNTYGKSLRDWLTAFALPDGRIVIFVVDAESGQILGREGG